MGVTHCITGNRVENRKNLTGSVTLTEHRDHHLLRHNVFGSLLVSVKCGAFNVITRTVDHSFRGGESNDLRPMPDAWKKRKELYPCHQKYEDSQTTRISFGRYPHQAIHAQKE